ncbi:MAG: hypothetical protein SW833_26395 [Cyanobacteriota bacterium]|nr:hypothetical protein [Cyanobacteriota bacterium]
MRLFLPTYLLCQFIFKHSPAHQKLATDIANGTRSLQLDGPAAMHAPPTPLGNWDKKRQSCTRNARIKTIEK